LGWVFGREYKKIFLSSKNLKEKEAETLLEDELYYEENELNSVPRDLRELLDCTVDLCKIKKD
jgi:hypothetical protein